MYCKQCGNEIPKNAVICIKCGVPIDTFKKWILILGYIFSFILPPIGLILGIYAIVRKRIGHGIVIILISLFFFIAGLAAILIPQFNKYAIRAYIAALKTDLKSAYSVSQKIFNDNPNIIINDAIILERAGFKKGSNDIVIEQVNISKISGYILMRHNKLNSANCISGHSELEPGQGAILYDGTLIVPSPK